MGHEKVARVRSLDWWVKANNMRSRTTSGGVGRGGEIVTTRLLNNCSDTLRNIHTNAGENVTKTRAKRKAGYFFVAHSVLWLWHTTRLLLHLGTLAKLRKATISFFASVCLSIRPTVCLSIQWEQLGSQWTEDNKTYYLATDTEVSGSIPGATRFSE